MKRLIPKAIFLALLIYWCATGIVGALKNPERTSTQNFLHTFDYLKLNFK